MSPLGYAKIHREIWEHWLWKKKPFSPAQAWIDMVLLANYKANKVPYRNQITEIGRGEFIRSRRDLAKRWGWTDSAVQRFIVLLEKDSMIVRKSDQKANHITICNYDKWQNIGTNNEPIMNHERTNREPIVNLNNKDKNSKEGKEYNKPPISPIGDFDIFWKAYPKKIGKGAALKAWKNIKPLKGTINEITGALKWQITSNQWLKDNGQFIPNPATYLNQKRWEDEPSGYSTGSPSENKSNQGRKPNPDNFNGKTYRGTPINQIPWIKNNEDL